MGLIADNYKGRGWNACRVSLAAVPWRGKFAASIDRSVPLVDIAESAAKCHIAVEVLDLGVHFGRRDSSENFGAVAVIVARHHRRKPGTVAVPEDFAINRFGSMTAAL